MATYNSKYIKGVNLKDTLRSLFARFKRVAYTGSYDDLEDTPEEMTQDDAAEMLADEELVPIAFVGPGAQVDDGNGNLIASSNTIPISTVQAHLWECVLPPTDISRFGYVPGNWSSKANGKGAILTAGSRCGIPVSDIVENCTFYDALEAYRVFVYWITVSYTIEYEMGGAPYMSSKTATAGTSLATSEPTWSGHTFAGWSRVPGGTLYPYNVKLDVFVGESSFRGRVVAYANWTENE